MTGYIREVKRGTWEIFVDLPRGADGKRQRKTKTVKGGKREAQSELTGLLGALKAKTFADAKNKTVGGWLEKWLSDFAGLEVKAKTLERYTEIVYRHLIPEFGTIKLEELSVLHIKAAYWRWLQNGRLDGKGGLSKQTVLHHHRVLHQALEQAVCCNLIYRNPTDKAKPPRPDAKDKAVLDDEQIGELLQRARGHRLYIAFLIAVSTGLRRGEICGLRWQDVDLDSGKMTITQVIGETRKGLTIKAPKTAKGRRVVDLPAYVVKELTRYKAQQAQVQLLLGSRYASNEGLVIAREDGSPVTAQSLNRLVVTQGDGSLVPPQSLTKAFTALRKRLGLSVTLHGLRHTHASQLMREDVHIKVVSERLGHSRVGFTLDTYSHLLPTQQEEAARRIDAAFLRVVGDG